MDKASNAVSAQEGKSRKKKGLRKSKKGLCLLNSSDIDECRDEGSELWFVPQLLQC